VLWSACLAAPTPAYPTARSLHTKWCTLGTGGVETTLPNTFDSHAAVLFSPPRGRRGRVGLPHPFGFAQGRLCLAPSTALRVRAGYGWGQLAVGWRRGRGCGGSPRLRLAALPPSLRKSRRLGHPHFSFDSEKGVGHPPRVYLSTIGGAAIALRTTGRPYLFIKLFKNSGSKPLAYAIMPANDLRSVSPRESNL
jgi:hypothetical protein